MGSTFPKIFVVEPRGADCLFRSHKQGDGHIYVMEGNLTTIMAGLNCGTPSHLGWRILKRSAEAFLSCEDQITIIGMNKLYYPSGADLRIISGESGAVGVGALSEMCKNKRYEDLKTDLGIDDKSNILIISTEGDTDVEGFNA